jgi:hypothetical protein
MYDMHFESLSPKALEIVARRACNVHFEPTVLQFPDPWQEYCPNHHVHGGNHQQLDAAIVALDVQFPRSGFGYVIY